MRGWSLAFGLAAFLAGTIPASGAQIRAAESDNRSPTFTKDIAPVVFRHCGSCHHPGGSAPFALVTYADLRTRARQVVTAVVRREMPPWKPEPGFGTFDGERRLTSAEIDLFERWLAGGAHEGSPTDLPPVPQWDDGWSLGPPDLVVNLETPYRVEATGPDRLRQFVLPVPISGRRFVRAWQFRTSSADVVHHATLMLDDTAASRHLDQRDPQPGFEGLVPLSVHPPEGYFLGWTPGQTASTVPDRMAWPLSAGEDLVASLHLVPNGSERNVDVSVGFYFSDQPPIERPVMIRLNRQDLDIPAGDEHYTAIDTYTLPVDVDAYGVQPHAHHLARSIRGVARLPDGTEQPIIRISDWDFHWQDAYRFRTPMALPAGSVLTMEIQYDNSAGNPRNPTRPPRRVTYGQRTSDEMGDLWIQVVPRRAADRVTLERSLHAKLLPQNISGYQMMVRADPANASLHDDLAMLYVDAGDLDHAIAELSESVRLRPTSPAAHYNLGNALVGRQRLADAQSQFREAVRLDPDYGLARDALVRVERALAEWRGEHAGKSSEAR